MTSTKIHITNAYILNINRTNNQLIKGDYYYTTDRGAFYQANSTYEYSAISNIMIVASEFDRVYNVPRIPNKYYYCLEKNQFWQYNEISQWIFLAGEDSDDAINTNFIDGSFCFVREGQIYSGDSKIGTKMSKINNMIFGEVYTVGEGYSTSNLGMVTDEFLPTTETFDSIKIVYQNPDGMLLTADIYGRNINTTRNDTYETGQIYATGTVPEGFVLQKGARFWYHII